MSLDEAKKEVGSFWSYLYPKKEDIESLQVNVPELIDTTKANEYVEIIKSIDSGTKDGIETFQDWFDTLDNGERWIAKYAQATQGQIRSTEDVIKANKAAREAAIAHNNALKQQTLSAKAATVATKALAIASNMIAMWAISKVISIATEKLDDWIHRVEKAKEASDELFSSFDNAQSKLSSHKELIEKVEESYEKLSSGVDSLGRNISLSEDEFAEYQSLCKQIAEYYPNMVSAWNKEGDAIVDLKGKVNELREAYEEERIGALNTFVASAGDVVDSYNLNANYSAKNGYDKTSGYKQQIAALEAYLDVIQNTDISEQAKAIQNLLEYGGEGFSGFDLQNVLKDLDIFDYSLDELPSYLSGVIKNLQTQLSTEDNSMKQMLLNMFELDSNDYADISDEAYQLGTTFINALDSSFFEDKNAGEFRSFTNDLLNELTGENATEVRNAIDSLLNLDERKSDLTSTEYADYLRDLISTLRTYLDLDENQIKLMIGMEVDEDPEQYADRLIDSVKNRFSNSDKDGLRAGVSLSVTPDLDMVYFNKAIEQMSQEYLETLNSLGDAEWDKLYQYINQESQKGANGIDSVTNAVTRLIDEYNNLEDAVSEITTSFTDALSAVQALSKGFDQLDAIYADVYDKEDFDWSSILNNDDFVEEFASMDDATEEYKNAYSDFIETVSNSPSDINACQQAFDNLASAYLYSSGILKDVTESTMDATVAMLEQMGVENAKEIVDGQLAAQQMYLALTTSDSTDSIYDQIDGMLNEGEASGIACAALFDLIYQQDIFSSKELNVTQKIQALEQLAKSFGITADVAASTANIINDVRMMRHYGASEKQIEDYANNALSQNYTAYSDAISAKFGSITASYTGGSKSNSAREAAKKAAGSAGKEAGEAFTDALDKELNALDKRMAAGYIDFNDYIQARLDLIEDYYRQGKISADEYYSYLEKHYNQQLSYMDKVINAVTRRMDKEIDSLEKRKDDIENYYKIQIDSLEKEKSLLEEANRERERQKALQESLYNLERARNQRTILQYSSEKGLHYVADDKSIREADQNVQDAQYQIRISEIEKSISKLEEARDRETDAIDAMIDKLKDYRDAWKDITSAYEEQQEDLIASQILGAGWEADILNGRLDVLEAFKNQYISIQQAMADAAWQSANAQIKAAQAASQGAAGTTSSAPAISTGGNTTSIPQSTVKKSTTSSNSRMGGGSKVNTQYVNRYASGTENAKKGINLVGEDGDELYFDNDGHVSIVTEPTLIHMEGGEVVKNENDTKKLLNSDNLAPVDTVGLADIDGKEAEYTIKVNIETNGEIPDIQKGTVSDDGIITLADGTELRPLQPGDEMYDYIQKFNAYFANMDNDINAITAPISSIQKDMELMVNSLNSVNNISNNNRQINFGDIHITCPGVTSQEVANQIGVELNKQFNGLHLTAMQESMKR